MDSDNNYFSVNELTEKLKEDISVVEKTNEEYKREKNVLKKENLENFILEKTGELVEEGLDTIKDLKSVFLNNPDSEEIEALSQAFKAVSSALSVLKDVQVTSMKNNSNKEIKQMELEAKREFITLKNKETEEELKPRILLTREEVIKALTDKSEIITGEFVKDD